ARGYKERGILNDNIFFFQGGELEKVIKEDSGVRSVVVKKRYPATIEIVVEEATPVIIWNTAGESFQVDERGYVIGGDNKEENLPEVYDSLNIETGLGERVASPTIIKYILDVSANFETIVGQKFEKIIIYDIFSDIRIKSDSTWTVYLDSSRDPTSELENLVRVLNEAKEEGDTSLTYIDMRLPDKVFYK
ncbi:MAG: FtsQ-type POTRA domain-containing protein, partial [Patescibacteria group bacterium]|nr:FtsQ-type POTRA domain-containing protein [Patescibacteria group bacterium]